MDINNIEEIEAALEEGATEDTNVPLTDEEVLKICKEDLATCKDNKTEIDSNIQDWRNLYDGEPLGNETDGRSKYVAKEASKGVNWWMPNALKPFMMSNSIASFAPRTADDVEKAKSQNILVNYQFNNSFPKHKFLHDSLQIFAIEGTAVARIGWIHEEETEVMPFEGLKGDQLMQLEQSGAIIEIEDQADVMMDAMESPMPQTETIYKGTATITKTTVSRPDAEPIRNEDFFIIGDTIDDADCTIQRIDTNRSDLRKQDKQYNKNGIYENVDDVVANKEDRESSLGQERDTRLKEYGKDADTKAAGKSREEVTIYEYYGNIDRNGDGIAEPIVCVWSGNTILRIDDNPFPDEKPPYIGAAFMANSFSFWGKGLPYFLEDNTRVKTAIMRTFIDLMASSTNGINHVEKGSLDALNMKRLKEAKVGSVVEWNRLAGYQPTVHNEIPQSLQQMYELFTGESENESGITRYSQGLDANSLNKTATGITAIMNQSQMRTWETVVRFAEQYMKPLFRKWIAYNQEFLDQSVAVRVVGDTYTEVSKDDIAGEFDLTIDVAIGGSDEDKANKIIQMLQMTQPLVDAGVLPPEHITKLIAELEEIWGFIELSDSLTKMVDAQEEERIAQFQQQQGNPQQGNQPPIQ